MEFLEPFKKMVMSHKYEELFDAIIIKFHESKQIDKESFENVSFFWFQIPIEIKKREISKIENVFRDFFSSNQDIDQNLKKEYLVEIDRCKKASSWIKKELIKTVFLIGEVENSRVMLGEYLSDLTKNKRGNLIEKAIIDFGEMLSSEELNKLKFEIAIIKNDIREIENRLENPKDAREEAWLYSVIERSEKDLESLPLTYQMKVTQNEIITKKGIKNFKKISNSLYQLLAIHENKKESLKLVTCYFIKRQRKSIAEKVLNKIKTNVKYSEDASLQKLEKEITKIKKDKAFTLEKDDSFDMAEDLFGDESKSDNSQNGKKEELKYKFDKEAWLIRQGVTSLEVLEKKLTKKNIEAISEEERSIKKELQISIKIKSPGLSFEEKKNILSSLIFIEMWDVFELNALEMLDKVKGSEERIAISYILALGYFKSCQYQKAITLSTEAVSNLSLLENDRVEFLRIISLSFRKVGKFKKSVSVEKLIHKLKKAQKEI